MRKQSVSEGECALLQAGPGGCAGPGSAGSDACNSSTTPPEPSNQHDAGAGSPQSHAAAPEGALGSMMVCGGEGAWEAQPGQTGGTLPRVHSANTLRQAPRGSPPWVCSTVYCT